jgi:hypothetical protein
MGMVVDTDVDAEAEELEDAPWCVNGMRVRYDGSLVGVCRVCRALGVSGSGAHGCTCSAGHISETGSWLR